MDNKPLVEQFPHGNNCKPFIEQFPESQTAVEGKTVLFVIPVLWNGGGPLYYPPPQNDKSTEVGKQLSNT